MPALTFTDLMSIDRIEGPTVSPDGRSLAYTTARHDPVANKVSRTIRLLDLASGESRELTPGPGNHSSPTWAPGSDRLALVSNRDDEHGGQLWVLPLDGGEARRITSGYGGVASPVWSPDGTRIALARSVVVSDDYRPGEDETVDPKAGPARAKVFGLVNEKSSARAADELLYRHWDHWRDRRRNHLFVVDVASAELSDVTPGDRDAPPMALDTARDFDWSPDGNTLAFAMNPDEVVARSTNNSIHLLPVDGIRAAGEARNISTSAACDVHPRFSPDGSLLYLAMATPGYEADRLRIKRFVPSTGVTTTHLESFDRSPHGFVVEGEGASLLFHAQDRGRQSIYRLELAADSVRQLTWGTHNALIGPIAGSDDIVVGRQTTTRPLDLFRMTPGTGIEPFLDRGPLPELVPAEVRVSLDRLTDSGTPLADVEMNEAEEFWYVGARGDLQHGFLIQPPDFDPRERYPLILLIHGGPQGAFADEFHYRWSAQMFAAQGAVVAFVNPTGSTGYGSALTEAISGDWGGACYTDIMNSVDYLIQQYTYIDSSRLTAAGASFGGFMINWILGHSDRFAALVCHDGVFSSHTMAYSTEELWFEDHEFGGLPHEEGSDHHTFDPSRHVANFKTPTLVVHSDNDFRCPMSEGIGLFTALQVQNVPSRFLHFPDEGHWITQPANSEVWYHETVGWLMKWVGGEA
jgi:dipeptidyl aminopeptidase/acylaminoacyl peptidase